MGLWNGLMRGAKALVEGDGPYSYIAGGVKVACPHCQGDVFNEAWALRNTPGMTFAGLDWADKRATTLICRRCGLMQWFARRPERIEPKAKPDTDWSDD